MTIEIHPWQDFGTNRTINLEHGRRMAATLGELDQTHLLLLDADMEIPAGTKPPKQLPKVGALPQRDPNGFMWSNVRTIRADVPGRYMCRTHEYLSVSEQIHHMDWFVINDMNDGGCKADKFERDERLLRKDLDEKPGDPRAMFYLAQTLGNLGRCSEAIIYYDLRSKMNDHPEEAWMAQLEASRCCRRMGRHDEADMRALAAYFARPQRAEPLAEVVTRATDGSRHHLAMALAKIGRNIPYPPVGEILYCGQSSYKWPFLYSEMISAFYTGEKARGAEASDLLRLTPGSPHEAVSIENAIWYCDVLPGERRPFPVVPMEGFTPASPCFAKTEDGWLAMIRMVNYAITEGGQFWIPGAKVITRNVVYRLNRKLEPQGDPIELISPPAPNPAAHITGFEDQRIVSINGDFMVTAGVRCDASPVGHPELWDAKWDLKTGTYLGGKKLSKGDTIEKNWMPFDGGYIYHHCPMVTLVDSDGNNPRFFPKKTINLAQFRGSAAPIPYKGGYLYVIHEVGVRGRRTYVHRFVHIRDKEWNGVRVSRPFFLHGGPCMESCFSINNVDHGILMSCAYEDKEVYTITVKNETILKLLEEGMHE